MEPAPSLTFPSLAAAQVSTPSALAGMGPAAPPASAADARTSVLDSLHANGGPAAAVPAALPLTAAIPAAWLAAPTLPAAAPAAAAASDPAPIATINDRRVRLPAPGVEEQDQVSLYRLCRQWVQNDPELAEAQEVQPAPASKLPPLPPHSEAAAATLQQQPPQQPALPASAAASAEAEAGGSSEPPAVETLLQHHRQHWAAVRQHKQAQAAAKEQRFAQRLQTVLTLAGGPAAPMPMQQ